MGAMTLRQALYYTATATMALVIWLLWFSQPQRQVQRHTARFIAEAEDKDWEAMAALVAEGYSDRWGHDRDEVLQRSRQVLAQFLILSIKADEIDVQEENGVGAGRARLHLTGRGGPLAEYAVERVSRLRKPFVFTWRQRSWKPWDWVLTAVDQPELELGDY